MTGKRQLYVRRARRARAQSFLPFLERVEDRVVLSTFVVTNTYDNGGINPAPFAGTGTLRQAIIDSNATDPNTTGGTSDIVFDIPASTAGNLGTPVQGFDPIDQTWTITLSSPLPIITSPVSIDGYSQAEAGVPFRYPAQLSSTVQTLSVSPPASLITNPNASFTITTNDPQLLPGGTTPSLLFNTTSAAQLQKALELIVGQGNVSVLGDPVSGLSFITFQGAYAGKSINTLTVTPMNFPGATTLVTNTVTPGGVPIAGPIFITSPPNTTPARAGNNAHARVIIDGHFINSQQLAVQGSPTSGTFTLTSSILGHSGTTTPIPFDAVAATVQTALESIVGPSNVIVTGGPAPTNPMTIYFTGQLQHQIIPPLTTDSTNLKGGMNPTITIQAFPVPQVLAIQGSPTGGTFTLTSSASGHSGTTAPIPYNADAAAVQAALESIVGAGNVIVTGGPAPGNPMSIYFTAQLQGQAIPPLTADGSGLTGGPNATVTISMFPLPQQFAVHGSPTGGTFTLTSSVPAHAGTTVLIPYNADAAAVQTALVSVLGSGNVIVTGGPAPGDPMTIYFTGQLSELNLPPLTADSSGLTGGVNPAVMINALEDTGFVLDTSHSTLRGLIIDGFGVGVSVPHLDASGSPNVGDLIQGNSIGNYFVYPVDPISGQAPAPPNNVAVLGNGNSLQGIVLDANNATVGGINPEENNVIVGNGQQGIQIQADSTGDVVQGNQIGLMGPSINGLYFQRGNRGRRCPGFGGQQ
jgi:hypothetical protein